MKRTSHPPRCETVEREALDTMPSHLDFSIPSTFLTALGIGVLQPLYLVVVTRIRSVSGRNALQFSLSVVIMVTLWTGTFVAMPSLRPTGIADFALGLMVLAGATLFYLGLWGLLSRGYTLGVLLTLNANRPLNEDEIANAYRGGEGLSWIMRHRFGGLIAAGLVERQGDRVTLTRCRGLMVARLYQISIATLGLRRTG